MRQLQCLVVALIGLALCGCKGSGVHPMEKHEAPEEVPEGRVLFEREKPTTSLAAAVTSAQQSVPDGRFLRSDIEELQGTTVFCILLASGDAVKKVNVDASTGKILTTETQELDSNASSLLAGIDKDPKSAACTVGQAIEAALAKAPGGWALSVGLGIENARLVYAVCLIDGKKAKVAFVSAADGSVGNPKVFEIRGLGEGEYSDLTEEPAISLARAIALARERASGERFLHAELGREDERANCLLVFWASGRMHILIIDAGSGAILVDGTDEVDPESAARTRKLAEYSGSTIEPAKAIEVAIAALPGSWARLITFEFDEDPVVYLVAVVAGEDVRYVRMGAADGKVLSVRTEAEMSAETETDD